MRVIDFTKEGEVSLLDIALKEGGGVEIENARLLGANNGPLKDRRHESIGPVGDAVDRVAIRIGENEVSGQVLGFRAQAIAEPRAECRSAEDTGNAAVKVANRDFVSIGTGVHAADEADVINDLGEVWEKFGEFGAALTVSLEFPWTGH